MNRLKELRIEKKLSTSRLAEILNVSNETILEYEKGVQYIEHNDLRKISDFYNVSYSYILGLSQEKETSDMKVLLQYKIDSFYKTNPNYELKFLIFLFNKFIETKSHNINLSLDDFKEIFNSPYEYLSSAIEYSLGILSNKKLKFFTKTKDTYMWCNTNIIVSYYYINNTFNIEISRVLYNYLEKEKSVTFLLDYNTLFENSVNAISHLSEIKEAIKFEKLKSLFNYQEEQSLNTSQKEIDESDFDLLYRYFSLLSKMVVVKKIDTGVLLSPFLDDFTFDYEKKSFMIGRFEVDINSKFLILDEKDFKI